MWMKHQCWCYVKDANMYFGADVGVKKNKQKNISRQKSVCETWSQEPFTRGNIGLFHVHHFQEGFHSGNIEIRLQSGNYEFWVHSTGVCNYVSATR